MIWLQIVPLTIITAFNTSAFHRWLSESLETVCSPANTLLGGPVLSTDTAWPTATIIYIYTPGLSPHHISPHYPSHTDEHTHFWVQ